MQKQAQNQKKPAAKQNSRQPVKAPAKKPAKSVKPKKLPQGSGEVNVYIGGAVLYVLLVAALLFSGCMTLSVEKVCGLIGCGAVVLVALVCFKRLKPRIGLLFLCVTAYVLWAMLSTSYAISGKFALAEATKLIVAYAFFLLVVALAPEKRRGLNAVLCVIAAATALIGILSVDAACSGSLSAGAFSALSKYTGYYSADTSAFSGARIGSFISNSNIYGELMALGVISAFWLTFDAKRWYTRLIGALLVIINLYSDVLAMSLVALFVCALGCVAMALLTKKGGKLSFLLLLAEGAAVTLAALLLSYSKLGTDSSLPMLCCLFGGAVLFALDSALRVPLNVLLKKASTALSLIITGATVVVLAGAALFLLNSTAPFEISSDRILSRNISIAPGDYTLGIETERPADVQVVIVSYDNEVTSIANSEQICNTFAEDEISFTVPESSKYCTLVCQVKPDTAAQTISALHYDGVISGDVTLDYKLLPDFITQRLQSLTSQTTAYQRIYLFKAGLALFAQNPIIGMGAGGYENGIYSVEEFFFTTKSVHNHYIQALCELGIIGFALYIGILLLSLRLLWKNRRDEKRSSAAPVLLALLIAMFGGAMSDVCWSSGNYLPAAFIVLALITVYQNDSGEHRLDIQKKLSWALPVIIVAFLIFGVCILQNRAAAKLIENEVSFDSLKAASEKDVFEGNDYTYSYVLNAPLAGTEEVMTQAFEYAEKLSKVKSNTMGLGLAQFYFDCGMIDEGFDCLTSYVDRNRADKNAWQTVFDTIRETFTPSFRDGTNMDKISYLPDAVTRTAALAADLEQTGIRQLDKLPLDGEAVKWLSVICSLAETGSTDEGSILQALGTMVYDSRYAGDFNEDGLPDQMYEYVNADGEDCIAVTMPMSLIQNYDVRWYDGSGKEVSSLVWTVEETMDYSAVILKSAAADPYVTVSVAAQQ